LRISDAPSPDSAARVQPAASSSVKENEHTVASGSVQDEISVGPVAVAASNSLDAPESKIAALRQQYLDGAYHVEADKLSAKIVDEHLLTPDHPDDPA
jgi:anti-sigma28 factor (negative regulator of flagellin synthesis)